jgi:hypothetical protein
LRYCSIVYYTGEGRKTSACFKVSAVVLACRWLSVGKLSLQAR